MCDRSSGIGTAHSENNITPKARNKQMGDEERKCPVRGKGTINFYTHTGRYETEWNGIKRKPEFFSVFSFFFMEEEYD